jgi:hypothetical protein
MNMIEHVMYMTDQVKFGAHHNEYFSNLGLILYIHITDYLGLILCIHLTDYCPDLCHSTVILDTYNVQTIPQFHSV